MYFRSFVSEREFVCVVVCHYYLLEEGKGCRIFGVGNINNMLLYCYEFCCL